MLRSYSVQAMFLDDGPYVHGFVRYVGKCSSCGGQQELKVAHPGPHSKHAPGGTRRLPCYVGGRLVCASTFVEMEMEMQLLDGSETDSLTLPVPRQHR